MWHRNVFDGRTSIAACKKNVLAAERILFAEGIADPVVGEEETLAGIFGVALEEHAEEILDFPFRVFGSNEDVL